jgi:hypothetical protein
LKFFSIISIKRKKGHKQEQVPFEQARAFSPLRQLSKPGEESKVFGEKILTFFIACQ